MICNFWIAVGKNCMKPDEEGITKRGADDGFMCDFLLFSDQIYC